MTTPLNTFLEITKKLAIKPHDFWLEADQKKLLAGVHVAIGKLKSILERKKMVDTHAYKILLVLEKSCSQTRLNEVPFIQALTALVDIYTHSTSDQKTKELISVLEKETSRAKKRILEYHLLLEALRKKGESMSEEKRCEADLKTLQGVGVFYVLEYTLQSLALWPRLNDKGKKLLLHDGISVKEGNLPAYLPLEETFRKDFCLKIHDPKLRHELLTSFYNFEEILYTDDVKKIGPGLKTFNISLLQTFEKKGLKTFKALIYKPFGNNIPMAEIREKINHSV